MKLFLCSHFSSVGMLMKEEFEGKNVVFIPTASNNEGYTGYVGSARKLWKKLGSNITEIDIENANINDINKSFNDADIIYFTGGNSFFLMNQLRKTGVDKLVKEQIELGKFFVGESAGAIICAPTISYIERMDAIPNDYCQSDHTGLSLIDFYILPHYLTAPFKKCTEQIINEFSELDIYPINNSQAILIENGKKIELNAR
ncbi:Type 1 glutamine amidotransferase-like domain-containing protein [[Clostridium] innocuum]|nr:Type 1 glutamine amidotransferase-like domain-containing protein [[Clostridium] innocuum]